MDFWWSVVENLIQIKPHLRAKIADGTRARTVAFCMPLASTSLSKSK